MFKGKKTCKKKTNVPSLTPSPPGAKGTKKPKIPAKTNVNISFAELDKDGGVVNLITTEGWRIIMDRQNDWEKQMQVLTIFLRDKIKDKRNNLHYIDVRYENRSYYQ